MCKCIYFRIFSFISTLSFYTHKLNNSIYTLLFLSLSSNQIYCICLCFSFVFFFLKMMTFFSNMGNFRICWNILKLLEEKEVGPDAFAMSAAMSVFIRSVGQSAQNFFFHLFFYHLLINIQLFGYLSYFSILYYIPPSFCLSQYIVLSLYQLFHFIVIFFCLFWI